MSYRVLPKPPIVPDQVRYIIIDSFCGAGGWTEGVERAVNRFGNRLAIVIVGVNHDKDAIASHIANHPETVHFVEDVRDKTLPRRILEVVLAVRKLYPNAQLLFHGSLECFPAGTLILTANGLIPIENIQVGELVLTHTGKWQPVTSTMQKQADTVVVRGQGHPGLITTAEHPFYARSQKRVWKNDIRRWSYKEMGEPEWIPANELLSSGKRRWATPVSCENLPIPSIEGRGMNLQNPDFWWMVGRWLGDGLSAPNRGGQISIVCGNHEVEMLAEKLAHFQPEGLRAQGSELRWQHRKLRTASIFYCSHLHLSTWLTSHFGRLSHGKTLPAWALSLPIECRKALLDGYVSADGHIAIKRTQTTSVSKSLAIGIRLLAESLGYRASLHEYESHNNTIEGRTVNVRNQWIVAWDNGKSDRGAFQDDLHAWSLVKEITSGDQNVTVYNLSVAEDESYVADGIVVHNCTNFSNAKGGKSRDADSRSLAEFMPGYLKVLKPDLFTVENVREFMAWGPMIAKVDTKHTWEGHKAPACHMVFDKKKKEWDYHWIPESRTKGKDYQRWIRQIQDMGFQFDFRLLNAADFGAYTSRLRYFAIFAKKNVRIVWPKPTHAKATGKPLSGQVDLFDNLKPWMPVRDVLDFSDEGHSIFGRKTNMVLRKQDRKDLVENSLERIYAGLLKHVAKGDANFLSKYYSGKPDGKNISLDGPAGTLTTADSHAIVKAAFLVQRQNDVAGRKADGRVVSLDGPARTVTTTGGNQELVQAFLSKYNGGSPECRNTSLDEPCGTLTTENRCAYVQASFLANYYSSGGQTSSVDGPAGSITTKDRLSLVQAEHFIDQQYGCSKPSSVNSPAGTLTANPKLALVKAEGFLSNPGWFGASSNLDAPSPTIVARQDKAPVSVVQCQHMLVNNQHDNVPTSIEQPAPTLLTGTHHHLVRVETGELAIQILPTDSPCTIKIKEFMAAYGIVDIKMRMLTVPELKRIQGFPDGYVLRGSETNQKKFIGNAVVPQVPQRMIEALALTLP